MRAEVPGHNPGLDSICPKGFQYTRETASCHQANCPPGAGRTYTLDCNCGEAWDKPFRTCYENGLATHCVARGAECRKDYGGFDPLSGQCQGGFQQQADGSCQPAFPAAVKCKVLDAGGQPLAGRALHFAEATGDKAHPYANRQDAQTGADGTAAFTVANRQAPSLTIKQDGPEGPRVVTFKVEAQGECVFHVFDAASFEPSLRDGYEQFLRGSCLDEGKLGKVRGIKLDFSGGGKPLYDPNDDTIHGIGVQDDYDELMRGLIHELGHGMIARAVDPGKDVGGRHNNWVPVDPKDLKAGTPEQLAFEEGAADFIAMLYFRQRGQRYQEDLEDDTAAGRAIEANGKDASPRTESMITRYLWSVYQPVIEASPDGAARALADFLQTLSYEQRQATLGSWSTDPARTIQEFDAARVKRAGDDGERQGCGFAPIDLDKMRRLAESFGMVKVPPVRMQPMGSDGHSLDDLAKLLPEMGKPGTHNIPAGLAAVTFQTGGDHLTNGKIAKLTVGGVDAASIEVEADGRVTLRNGTAVVSDGPARTTALEVVPMGTAYVVRVADGTQTVAVALGKVDVVERAGARRRVALTAGQAADWTEKGGFSPPRAATADLERARPSARGSRAYIPWLAVAGSVAAAFLALLLVLRRRSK